MTPFLLYIARTSLYLAIFYAFFLLIMRHSSLFAFNRFTLLSGTLCCHLLPLVRLRTVIIPAASGAPAVAQGSTVSALPAPPFPFLTVLYLAGVASVLVLCALSVRRTCRIIRSGTEERCEGCRLTLTDRDIPSFSWGRRAVMSRDDYKKYPAILAHELQHIRRHHSLDVLLMSATAAVHWFNPLVWIARAELNLLHEYEADAGLLRQGIDATQYQLLLVRKAVGERRFSLANGFHHARLKQRIQMMHSKPSSPWMRLAYVALLPLLAGAMFFCNPVRAQVQDRTLVFLDGKEYNGSLDAIDPSTIQSVDVLKNPEAIALFTSEPVSGVILITTRSAGEDSNSGAQKLGIVAVDFNPESVPFSQVDVQPTFRGENAAMFNKWLAEHVTYPTGAKLAGIEGEVTVAFDITADGSVKNVRIVRGVNELLDAEAVRVVSASPRWEPGTAAGKPVQVSYSFPIMFRLK